MTSKEKIWNIIYDVIYNNIFLNEALSKHIYDDNDNIYNKSYIKRSVSGILENKILIDYIIDKYSNTKINKLDKKVYITLLCSIYELLFMDNKKDYAIVNEYVEIIKKKKKFYTSFTNAILRNVLRNETREKIYNDTNIDFRIKYSIPNNLYEYLYQNLNIKTTNSNTNATNNIDIKKTIEDIFVYYHNNNLVSFRINTLKKDYLDTIIKELNDKNIDYYIYDKNLKLNKLKCIIAKNIKNINDLNCFTQGLISVQDISSIYYIDKLYDLIHNDSLLLNNDYLTVLDACAAPLGKSLAFLRAFDDKNINITVCDKTEEKIKKIKENLEREKENIKFNNMEILIKDATKYDDSFRKKYDIVLLDVPCSGLGIISKKPDIKYNFDENKINSLINIQKNILDTNKNYIKNNGYLCYSTCTINKKENTDMIDYFLNNNKDYKLIYYEQILSSIDNMSDGFYFSIMKRENDEYI